MMGDFDFCHTSFQLYDIQCSTNFQIESQNDNDLSSKKIRLSSQCLPLKKKIKHKQSRPSLLRIDETARNVKIYSLVPSQSNLDLLDQKTEE